MINLQNRSYKKEILDNDDVPFEDIKKNMQELNTINTLLGGHKITIDGFKELSGGNGEIIICEIGCGGGDNLQAIQQYCLRKKIKATFIGIDIKKECLAFAREQYPKLPCEWICKDYAKTTFENKPTIIFSSLFCHHFTNEDLVKMLYWMKENSTKGFFVNDLQRNIIAYYAIKWLTVIFSNSYMVKNDAPLSVSRGFHKNEWQEIIAGSGVQRATIQWKWAFRYLLIYNHG